MHRHSPSATPRSDANKRAVIEKLLPNNVSAGSVPSTPTLRGSRNNYEFSYCARLFHTIKGRATAQQHKGKLDAYDIFSNTYTKHHHHTHVGLEDGHTHHPHAHLTAAELLLRALTVGRGSDTDGDYDSDTDEDEVEIGDEHVGGHWYKGHRRVVNDNSDVLYAGVGINARSGQVGCFRGAVETGVRG